MEEKEHSGVEEDRNPVQTKLEDEEEEKAEVKRLPPIPSLSEFPRDRYSKHPLLKYSQQAIKNKAIEKFRVKGMFVAKEVSARRHVAERKEGEIDYDEHVEDLEKKLYLPFYRQEYWRSQLRKSAYKYYVHPLLDEWLEKICSHVPMKLRKSYPECLKGIREEVKVWYEEALHVCCAYNILKPLQDEERPKVDYSWGWTTGRTAEYPNFLKKRKRLEAVFVLNSTFIRGVLNCTGLYVPDIIHDYSKYRKPGAYKTMDAIISDMYLEVKKSAMAITHYYYLNVVKLIVRDELLDPEVIKPEKIKKLLYLGTVIIQVNIVECVRRSVAHFLDVLRDRNKFPFLSLEIHHNDETNMLDIYPLREDIQETFHLLLDQIFRIGSELETLEGWAMYVLENPNMIPINIGSYFMEASRNQLTEILDHYIEEYHNFRDEMYNQYAYLFDGTAEKEIQEFLATGPDISELKEKALVYRSIVLEMIGSPANVYFDTAKIKQTHLTAYLRDVANNFVKSIVTVMSNQHMDHCVKICKGFMEIGKFAITIPANTAHLVEINSFMIHATGEGLKALSQEVLDTIEELVDVVDMTPLKTSHSELCTLVFTWPERIKYFFDRSIVLYEYFNALFAQQLSDRIAKLQKDIEECFELLDVISGMCELEHIDEYIQEVRIFVQRIRYFEREIAWINKEEELFKMSLSIYPEFDDFKMAVKPIIEMVYLLYFWARMYKLWMHGDFKALVYETIETLLDDMMKEVMRMVKEFVDLILKEKIPQLVSRIPGATDDPDPKALSPPVRMCRAALAQIREFRDYLPIISILCNPHLKKRHWKEMCQAARRDITPNLGTTLKKVLNMGLEPFMDAFETVSAGATKEYLLEASLKQMKSEWADIRFNTKPYKDFGVEIIGSLEEMQAMLDDHLLKCASMRGSPFISPFAAEFKEWDAKLKRVNETLEYWIKVQTQWMYFIPIFSSPDIVRQMPKEGQLFKQVDLAFRREMINVVREPLALERAGATGVLERFIESNQNLETINRGVVAYLEAKRLYFPRFFFLSNDEILEILSETKDPLRVQPHLKKCFEGIYRLQFDEMLNIYGMLSAQGERIPMDESISTVDARGCVELWLVQVEEHMLSTIRAIIMNSNLDYATKIRHEWVTLWPGQVVLCVSQVQWTASVHEYLDAEGEREDLSARLWQELQDIVIIIRGKLDTQVRMTLEALVVIDVHAKDVTEDLVKKRISSSTEFQWLAQMRYYLTDNVYVHIVNAEVRYGYEYLGNSRRLVITPLTDRCYRTLMGAFSLNLYGAPEGPAGTGKTETTKDLAKALAVYCYVFNCSDALDYLAMGKFFKGCASCGSWVCFDEFNRIDLEVLSVIAQQILCIIIAVRARLEKFVFEGTELTLNPNCYVAITMNPGYAGRSELPDNLKALFRTVAMMVPDYAMIAEISLYSYGYSSARNLSVKIVTTYKLCSEQLSSQFHYDYGMRAVNAVLCAAGIAKLKYVDEEEDILLLRSIKDVNMPKFLAHDIPLFNGIISDLFPGIVVPAPDYDTFLQAVSEASLSMNLQSVPVFCEKVIQMYEMMIVRHGFMLVGEPFGGKTAVIKVLAETLNILHRQGEPEAEVQYATLNPKAISMAQLYGQFDPVSREWYDGVLSIIFRAFSTDESPERKWVIFDGPVDAVWIENMNTVLDDNKKLCLMSGEVMSLTPVMSMIFEVMDLSQASPATVSRCGMIYLEPTSLGWEPLVSSWLNNINEVWLEKNPEMLPDALEWLITACLSFVRKNCYQLITTGASNLVCSFLRLVDLHMEEVSECLELEKYANVWLQSNLVESAIWSLAGILDENSRQKFDLFYRELWRGKNDDHPLPRTMGAVDTSIPPKETVYDFYYEYRNKGEWKCWVEKARSMRVESATNIMQLLVPTIDTLRYQHLFRLFIKHKVPFLLVGSTGTGKSMYIQDMLLNNISEEEVVPAFVAFTARTSANQVQELIISKLDKRRKDLYSAPRNKICAIFVDDLNLPLKEQYGAQPPIELLRQYMDHGYWFDLTDRFKLTLQDVLLISAMGPPGGSRQDITLRYLRHFNVVSINPFSDESMIKIFHTVLFLGLQNNGFGPNISAVANNMVLATMNVYKSASQQLRPTPAKSHYIFNLRDVARIVQCCALLKKESGDDMKMLTRLWVHEILRVIYDRLIDAEDRAWLYNKIRDGMETYFREKYDDVFEDLAGEGKRPSEDTLRDLFFGNYMDPNAVGNDRRYEEVTDFDQFCEVSLLGLQDYNTMNKRKMDLVLFRYALEHLSRVCRMLAMRNGNGLLVGVGGSGRQSITRLAASMSGCTLFQPEISKEYGTNEFREDIKKVLKLSGVLGKHAVLLMTDSQMKEESFLEDVDSLLNSGEVPNLYAMDEKQEILEMVTLAAQGGNRNLDISPLAVFRFFINRSKDNMHIILCFSPLGNTFRKWLISFPSLINCCTIDWFHAWPEDALEKIAQKFMEEINIDDRIKPLAVDACKYFHVTACNLSEKLLATTGRHIYITPTSFLELIACFKDIMEKKQNEVMAAKNRYLGGLDQLLFAAGQIAEMQKELSALKPRLIEAAAITDRMILTIEKEKKEVETISAIVKKDKVVADEQAAITQALKTECEIDLAEALPYLEDALRALNTLKPQDITFVKSMKNPPAVVKLVLAAVCVIRGIKATRVLDTATGRMVDDYWAPSLKMLGNMNFLQELRDFEKDNIPAANIDKIRKEYITNKDFDPKIVAKASSAAEGLCQWVRAMDVYDKVIKVVAPKQEKLFIVDQEYQATMQVLLAKEAEVKELEDKLAELEELFSAKEAEKIELELQVNRCSDKIIRAEMLIGGLGGERMRWTKAAEDLQGVYDNLAGAILVSSGFIAYLSPFTHGLRLETVEDWHRYCLDNDIPCSEEFTFRKTLGSDLKIQQWNIQGLPRDDFSADNAIIVDNCKRWPLMIDPQIQANKWIKNMEWNNGLFVIKFTDKLYMRVLERALQMGKPVLFENALEELEPSLEPLLLKQYFKQAGYYMINLGDRQVDYNLNFRLYITTKLRNPHYLPEVSTKVTLINFALTPEGLQDQLMGIVSAKVSPELEKEKEEVVIEIAQYQQELADYEDKILHTLSSARGNILEKESAIKILNEAKILSVSVKEKVEISSVKQKEIQEKRMAYQPIASYCAVLYYCITDLPNVDPMYQYSLSWFINLFTRSVEFCNPKDSEVKNVTGISGHFTFSLYQNVCLSLFEKHKSLFSIILCFNLMLYEKSVSRVEVMFLLTGGVGLENLRKNPAPSWLSDKSWDALCRMCDLPNFEGFLNSFESNLEDWNKFCNFPRPEDEQMPKPWHTNATGFQKLMIMKALRPDRIILAVYNFVEQNMGRKYMQPPQFNIQVSYEESDFMVPLIFLLSAGSDPMSSLLHFAEVKGYDNMFQAISLGQGQGPVAQEMITKAQRGGEWVCLQNCHLAVSWMPQLETIVEGINELNTHPSFRLWLTSYPSDQFPVSILQNSVKMTNDPPTGLQQNILKSYLSEPIRDEAFYTGCENNEEAFQKLLFSLCFFHALVQERRKYGPIGWNIPYGFNETDLNISIMQLKAFMNDYDQVQYEAIAYLTGECNYGGRVTDAWDRRTLTTILMGFVSPTVINETDYSYSESGLYTTPLNLSYDAVLEHIQSLPSIQLPEVFGLHENVGIVKNINDGKEMFNMLLLVMGGAEEGGSKKSDQIIFDVSSDILSKLPPNFDLELALQNYPVEYEESMNTVLVQEMDRFNRLITRVHSTLVSVQKAVKGLITMSSTLEAVANSLLVGKVPASWAQVSYPSMKPLAGYVTDLLERIKFLQKWHDEGKPISFWISGFFFTQAFLTGAMQNFARKYAYPIDKLAFDFKVMNTFSVNTPPDDGVYVYGSYLDGARWSPEKNCLVEQLPNVLYYSVPIIWLVPKHAHEVDSSKRYLCPLYKTSARRGVLSTTGHSTNFVIAMLLDTEKPATHWIRRGVAMLCQLDD